jgi:hypothetical protein
MRYYAVSGKVMASFRISGSYLSDAIERPARRSAYQRVEWDFS